MFKELDCFDDGVWERARGLNLSDVGAALVAQGWERVELDDRIHFRRPAEENDANAFDLPGADEAYPVPVILNAVSNYARFLDKPASEAFEDWRSLRWDRARFRVTTEETVDGSIPFDLAVALVQGVVGSVSSAVRDVETSPVSGVPSGSVKSRRVSSLRELRRRARFGQTEKGSYTVNVAVPLDSSCDACGSGASGRLVFRSGLEHLTSTLSAVGRAATRSDADFQREMENEQTSAELLDAILQTSLNGRADVEISVAWSPLVAPGQGAFSRVVFKREYADKLRTFSQTARSEAEERRGVFYAKVVALKELARRAFDGRPSGKVVFRVFEEDAFCGDELRVETLVDEQAFEVACRAFYPNSTVAFDALVKRRGGKGAVEGLSNLRIVDGLE